MVQRTRKRDPFLDGQTTAVTVVEQAAVELYYDYSTVPEAYRDTLRRSAITIKPRLKRSAEDIFVIGKELRATKTLLPHGEYSNWLDVEFGLSDRMAQRFVNVYERLGPKSDIMSDLPPTTLYLLAAPSTPDEAIQTVEKELDAGERISVSYIQRVITIAKQNSRPDGAGHSLGADPAPDDGVNAPDSGDRMVAGQRLEVALAQVIERLNGQPLRDWSLLFHTNELKRACAELVRLQALLQSAVGASKVTE